MKRTINRLSQFARDKNLALLATLGGSLAMATLHFVGVALKFDWTTLNYGIFCLGMFGSKAALFFVAQSRKRRLAYLSSALCVTALTVPMIASILLTVLFRQAPVYPFEWIVYAYAFYGTVKTVLAVRGLVRTRKRPQTLAFILAMFNLVGAAYTVKMLEWRLINFAGGSGSESMMTLQMFTQGAVFALTVAVAAILFVKYVQTKKNGLSKLKVRFQLLQIFFRLRRLGENHRFHAASRKQIQQKWAHFLAEVFDVVAEIFVVAFNASFGNIRALFAEIFEVSPRRPAPTNARRVVQKDHQSCASHPVGDVTAPHAVDQPLVPANQFVVQLFASGVRHHLPIRKPQQFVKMHRFFADNLAETNGKGRFAASGATDDGDALKVAHLPISAIALSWARSRSFFAMASRLS